MSDFFEIFNPGMRHTREQRDAEKMLIVTNEQGGTGPTPLDLESGSVVLRMPKRNAYPSGMEAPTAPVPDDKDWTFVLQRSCPECGYTAAGVDATLLPSLIRTATSPWAEVLGRADAAVRPSPQVWSPLEYACHVRDVLSVFSERIELVRSEDGPTFANWDQDATAVAQRYWEADPAVVAVQIDAAAEHNANLWAQVGEHEWQRPATRSDGSKFTLETLGTYELHDLVHHLHDVGVL